MPGFWGAHTGCATSLPASSSASWRCRWRWRLRSLRAPSPSKVSTPPSSPACWFPCSAAVGADCRSYRRVHRHPVGHYCQVRHRRAADRDAAGRRDPAAARRRASGRDHQVHSRSGHRRFTAGIGVIIWTGQWQDFFGLPAVSRRAFSREAVAPAAGLPAAARRNHRARTAGLDRRGRHAARAHAEARAGSAAGTGRGHCPAGDVELSGHRHDRHRLRRHPLRPAVVAAAGCDRSARHRADRPGVRHCDARRDRVAAVGRRCRRHGRHAPRLQSGAYRSGYCEHRRAPVRRLRRDRRDRQDCDERAQRRHEPARGHRSCAHAGAHHPVRWRRWPCMCRWPRSQRSCSSWPGT